MNRIDHPLLDIYGSVQGEIEKLPSTIGIDPELWEIIDQLLLDLHMIRHGYTTEGYERFVDRRLQEVCSDATVEARMRELRL